MSRVFLGLRLTNNSVLSKCFRDIRLRGAEFGKLPVSSATTVTGPSCPGYASCRAYSYVPRSAPISGEFGGSRARFDAGDDEQSPSDEEVARIDRLARQHREEARAENATDDTTTFANFPLDDALLRSLEELGYKTPFMIQTKTLEHTLNGRDVIGRAVTGSGKTLAFAIPIVHKLSKSPAQPRSKSPRAIVIAPTRELCNQIFRSIQELNPQSRCVALYGGDSYVRQQREIQRGVDVVCATPGRLRDHLERDSIDLQNLQFLCLDEADELLTPNFREQIENVFSNSPKDKQVLMFSATMPSEVKSIAMRYMKDAQFVDIVKSGTKQAPKNIEHQCIKAPASHHIPIVAKLLSQHNAERCIVFLKTKLTASRVAQMLGNQGLAADAIHSDLTQSRREKILSSFRVGDLKVLCATDVAARGLDIPEVDLVVQVEPPANGLEYYIHRAGRTGRAGRKGLAILLHSGHYDEMRTIQQISQMVEMKHISPPEDVFKDLEDRKLVTSLDKIKKVTDLEREKIMPIVTKLLESGADLSSVLASALVVLSKPSYEAVGSNFQSNSDNRAFSRPSYNNQNSYSSNQNSYNSGRSSYRPNFESRSNSQASYGANRFGKPAYGTSQRKSLNQDDFDY